MPYLTSTLKYYCVYKLVVWLWKFTSKDDSCFDMEMQNDKKTKRKIVGWIGDGELVITISVWALEMFVNYFNI